MFEEVTVDLCRRFREHLLMAKKLRPPFDALKKTSASGYFSTFQALLKIAYRDGMIRENVNEFLDQIKYKRPKIEFLTMNELHILSNTPCEIDVLKRASLFSCLTGLRRSDVLNLDWRDFSDATEGGENMRIKIKKTEDEATLPISEEALAICGERRTSGKVFERLTVSMTNYPLKRWIKQAGINKRITFHCFRHTFATLQIAEGTSLLTVSKMLTHASITSTQIYADVVDELKRESANKISLNLNYSDKN
jgi:Site-specific recombinase XerD